MKNENTLKKVAVVSGGFGYVGLEIIKQLSLNNFLVAVLYNTASEEKVSTHMKELSGDGHVAYACNLNDAQSVEAVFDLIEKKQGAISLCVHSAGQKPERKKLHLTTLEELREQLENNVITSFNFLTNAAKKLKEHKAGMLVGVTTIGVIIPEATKSLGAYIPAKYAVQGMLTMLKDEMLPYGVEVYSIAPGFMSGGMNSDIPQAFVQMIQAKTVKKELASAKRIAETIINLCCKKIQSSSLTIPIAPEYNL
jgi:NAD(P)-dependent dehydrogenase (short-subunit alcohol dehydrogenase family)